MTKKFHLYDRFFVSNQNFTTKNVYNYSSKLKKIAQFAKMKRAYLNKDVQIKYYICTSLST